MPVTYILISAFSISWLLTYAVRRYAVNKSILDIPNERSSHTVPTPRVGGLAIAITFLLGIIILAWQQLITLDIALALGTGGIVTATIGYLDDRFTIGAQWRLLIHFLAAAMALYFLGGFNYLTIGLWHIHLGWLGNIFAALLIVWFINLYNFMDGIDGLAGTEGIFVAAIAGAALLVRHQYDMASLCLLTMAVISGFQCWNWPPAKIFMGDVSSGLLGFIFAIFILYSVKYKLLPFLFWIILLAVFIVDTFCTLLLRIYRREKWYAAHRSHAYQILVQRGYSHRRVTLSIMAFNLLLLLPLAWLTLYYPAYSLLLCAMVLLTLYILWWKITKPKC